jgi:hypothetical protein
VPDIILSFVPLLVLALLLATCLVAPVNAEEKLPRTWVEISVFCQCCEPPWGRSGTEASIRPWFERHGVQVFGYRTEARTVCAACSCPSTPKQLIRIRDQDAPKVKALLTSAPSATQRVLPSVLK